MMLKFDTQQWNGMQDAALADLSRRIAAEVREVAPYTAVAADRLTPLVRNGIDRAIGVGLRSERGICQFVMAMACVSPAIDLHAECHAVLTDGALPPDDRVEALLERLEHGMPAAADLPQGAWGWYVSRDAVALDPVAQMVSSLQLLSQLSAVPMFQRQDARQCLAWAEARAAQWAWEGQDAVFTLAAALGVYGPDTMESPSRSAWMQHIADLRKHAAVRLVMLRSRISLSTCLWV